MVDDLTMELLYSNFAFVALGCRWPLDAEVRAALIRASEIGLLDWGAVVRIAIRHRVAGQLHHALQLANVAVPTLAWRRLTRRREAAAKRNSAHAAELVRLHEEFLREGVVLTSVKGITLAERIYGSFDFKINRDIDLLVSPSDALASLRLLERNGYALVSPARALSGRQLQAFIKRGYQVELVSVEGRCIELHWRLTENPMLLKLTHPAMTQPITIDRRELATLRDQDLFAYLAAHGAMHDWFRLKWLADINALVSACDQRQMIALYRNAERLGAGLCAAQALLLCERVLGLTLPYSLESELRRNKRAARLADRGLKAMNRPHEQVSGMVDTIHNVIRPFRLGRGADYFRTQVALTLVGRDDVIRWTFPQAFEFLYPLLRVPFWIWRVTCRRRIRGDEPVIGSIGARIESA